MSGHPAPDAGERSDAEREELLRESQRRAAELERAQAELRRSEVALSQAGQMASLGAWWIEVSNPEDLAANPLRWSDEVFRIFGYEPGAVEVSSALFFEHVHPEDRRRVSDAVAHALAARIPYAVEHRIVRRDGSERTVLERGDAHFDDAGSPVLLVGAVQDVTEQVLAQEALRVSEERLRLHIANSPLAVIEFDSAFRVTRWSEEAERMFGWTVDEVVGRAIAELRWVHDDDVDSVGAECARFLSGAGARTLNVNRNYRKDGAVIHCEWYNSAIYDGQGRLILILSQVLDVTARRRAEDALPRERGAVPRGRGQRLPARLDGGRRGPEALVQQALVRVHRHDPRRGAGLGLAEGPPPRARRPGHRRLRALRREGRGVGGHLPAARTRRRVSLVPVPGRPHPRTSGVARGAGSGRTPT